LSGDDARDLRWALLKKPGDHTEAQAAVLKRHQRAHHSIWRAQQLKERFRGLYQLDNPTHATAYLDRWLTSACRSRIRPMVKVSQLVRDHKAGIIASVELGLSNSRLERDQLEDPAAQPPGLRTPPRQHVHPHHLPRVREHHHDPPMGTPTEPGATPANDLRASQTSHANRL
jgi:hypothetical protein